MSDAIEQLADSFSTLISAPDWLAELRAPHFEEYFGVWAYEEGRFMAALEQARSMDLRAHMAEVRAAAGDGSGRGYQMMSGGIAVIGLHGTLMKHVGSMTAGTSTALARRAVRQALNDSEVQGIMLHIDSPGGTVAGTGDLADDVAMAAAHKPVHGFIEDLGASAAFWIASQASRLTAGGRSLVGSIGTYSVVYDVSGAAAQQGIKTHVIRAGKYKGAGTPGAEVTAEQLAEWQRIVDALNEHFLAGVAGGRKLAAERVRELADGRVHMAVDARKLGLIDAVGSWDQAMANLRKETQSNSRARMASASSNTETSAMADQNAPTQPAAASIVELKSSIPDATAEFREKCVLDGLTLAQAKDAWMGELRSQNGKLQQDLQARGAELEQAKAATARKTGVKPLATGQAAAERAEEPAGDAVGQFNAAVAAKVAGGTERRKASVAVAKERPELHRAFLEATNPGRKQRALIAERFDGQ